MCQTVLVVAKNDTCGTQMYYLRNSSARWLLELYFFCRESYYHAFDNVPDPLAGIMSGRANGEANPDRQKLLEELFNSAKYDDDLF